MAVWYFFEDRTSGSPIRKCEASSDSNFTPSVPDFEKVSMCLPNYIACFELGEIPESNPVQSLGFVYDKNTLEEIRPVCLDEEKCTLHEKVRASSN